MIPQLRPYQTRAVADVLAARDRGLKRVVLVAPTGAGKTQCFCALIQCFDTALVLTHRIELIEQAQNRLAEFGIQSGAIQGDQPRTRHAVQVASVQTLVNRERPPADLVICDEAHHSVSEQFRETILGYPDAFHVGVTATPYRLDGRGLGELYQEIIVAAHPRELVELGYLVAPQIFSTPAPDLTGVHKSQGDYAVGELFGVMTALNGRVVETWQKRAAGKSTVVFAVNIQHSQDLAERFRESGVYAEHFDANTTKDERRAILNRFRSGKTTVLSNCNLISEGFDLPAISCISMARPTASRCMYKQQAGRALRPIDGKDSAIILDHAGNYGRFGDPMDLEEYSLEAGVSRKNPKGDLPIKQCPNCFAVVPAGVSKCPQCGHVFVTKPRDIREDDTELVLSTQIQAHYQKLTTEEKIKVYTGLIAQCKQLGFKPGWSAYQYKDRFGQWPEPEVKAKAEAGTDLKERALARWLDEAESKNWKRGAALWKYKAAYGSWPSSRVVSLAEGLRNIGNQTT